MKIELLCLSLLILLSACGQANGASTSGLEPIPSVDDSMGRAPELETGISNPVKLFMELSHYQFQNKTQKKLAKILDQNFKIQCQHTCTVEKK